MEAAINAWRSTLGDAAVETRGAELQGAGTTTFAAGHAPAAILAPADKAGVVDCVAIARQHGIALHPVSRGRTWGFGSRACPRPGMALLDLSHLRAIEAFDPEQGTLRVEPGVTFAQISEFLKEREADYYLAVTGGPADASVLANALERGEAFGPGGDRAAETYDLEVVLGNGDTIRTGFGRFFPDETDSPAIGALHRRGLGPNLDGLFQQSNMGIVLAATVALTPLPAFTISISGEIGPREKLAEGVDVLRGLLRDEVIPPYGLTIWNSCKLFARDMAYTDLAPEQRRAEALDTWSASAILTAPNMAIADAKARTVSETLADRLASLSLVTDRDAEGQRIPSPLSGTPSNRNLRSLYWRKPAAPEGEDYDPDRDRCGAIWLCPTLPFAGAEVAQAVSLMTDITTDHEFEANIGLHAVSYRCLHGFWALMYDRDIDGEDDRAMACYGAVADAMVRDGYLPYRLGLQGVPSLDDLPDRNRAALAAIKAVLDPDGAIGPGLYGEAGGLRRD